jgi:hypothetical protein
MKVVLPLGWGLFWHAQISPTPRGDIAIVCPMSALGGGNYCRLLPSQEPSTGAVRLVRSGDPGPAPRPANDVWPDREASLLVFSVQPGKMLAERGDRLPHPVSRPSQRGHPSLCHPGELGGGGWFPRTLARRRQAHRHSHRFSRRCRQGDRSQRRRRPYPAHEPGALPSLVGWLRLGVGAWRGLGQTQRRRRQTRCR